MAQDVLVESPTYYPDMKVHNDLIGDREALDAAWERDGYWYFKGVLDQGALGRFRDCYMQELRRLKVIDDDAATPIYNGTSMDDFPVPTPFGYGPHEPLIESRAWVDFTRDPAIAAFFAEVLGSPAIWVPVAEYRLWPPNEDRNATRLVAIHQDGFYNQGYSGRTCWVPVWDVTKEMGGLAVAEGMHKSGYFHDPEDAPLFPFPPNTIPDSAWRTADYAAGDVVLFDRYLPHSGMRNYSDRYFRLSFDVRLVPAVDNAPMTGHVLSVDPEGIEIRTDGGEVRALKFAPDTYCRDYGMPNEGKNVEAARIPSRFPPGAEVLIAAENGEVKLMRKPKY